MKIYSNPVLNALEEQELRRSIAEQESKKQSVDHNWTSAHKKHSYITFESEGKEKKIKTMDYLKKLAAELPAVKDQNGRTVNHFENLRRRFMCGHNPDESRKNVSDYCKEMEELKEPLRNTAGFKLFIIDETEWIAAKTKEEAIEFQGLLEDEVDSIEEIPESRWNEEIEVYRNDELHESEEPEMITMTIWELMRPALESGETTKVLTEEF